MNLLYLLFLFSVLVFWGYEACGLLASEPGMELAPPALEGEV